jgi:2-aminomuconate deaminase
MSAPATAEPGKPLGKYPLAKRVGDLVFVSGTTARLADGGLAGVTRNPDGAVHRDVAVQTRTVIEHIEKILGTLGCTLADCVDITVFLTDMRDFAAYNRIYGEYFDQDGPTRTTVAVSSLPHPDMVVELKAIALAPRPAAA